jgi:1,4-alpha-glucan branching enzyme
VRALHELDFSERGFQWVDCDDADISVIAFLRHSASGEPALVVCNFTPVPRERHRLGVPHGGRWRERLNSDAADYGGSGQGNLGVLDAAPVAAHGFAQSLELRLPPLAVLILTPAL